jgi:hypothetical protein
MTCAKFEERIARHVGGDLARSEAAAVEQHLRACARCAELARELEEDRVRLACRPPGTAQVGRATLENGSSVYTVSYSVLGPAGESTTLNLAEFRFAIKFNEIDSHIKSDLTIREGQKLVLGKIRLRNGNPDLFLVLTTKVY